MGRAYAGGARAYCKIATSQGTIVGIRFFEPWEDLRDVVARIYVHESDALPMADHRWLIVPDGDIKLIFPFHGDIACTIGDIQRVHGAARIIVSGMRTLPGYLDFSQDLGAVGVIVRPEAAYRLLGVPQHEIANRTFDAEEVLGGAVRQWQEALANATSTEGRVNGIQESLRTWLKGRDRRDPCLEYVVRRLKRVHGRVRIEELAREAGWSRRQLERKCLVHVGVGPKGLASIYRFQAVYKQLRHVAGGRYDDLVLDHYYDQSHFLKDFRRYTEATPRAYAQTRDYGRLYIPS